MRILVLGGAGFIGGNLIPRLLEDSANHVIVFDMAEPKVSQAQNRCTFVRGRFDADCDFAGLTKDIDIIYRLISTSVPGTEQDAVQEMTRNVIPSMKLFQNAAANGVKHVVFLSSGGTVYGVGDGVGTPNKESDPPRPINTYGLQKLSIEESLRFISRVTPMTHHIIRLSNPYGPGQNPHGPLGLVTKLVYQTLHHETIRIYGDGSVVRDFIYIDDAVHGILKIASHGALNDTYNLGTGRGTSVLEVVQTISEVLAEPMQVDHIPGRAVDVPVSVLDISKFKQSGFLTAGFISLREGIRNIASFFQNES